MDNYGMAEGEFTTAKDALAYDLVSGFSAKLPALLHIDNEPRNGYCTYIEYGWHENSIIVEAVSVHRADVNVPPVTSELLREVRIAEHSKDNLKRIVTRFGKTALPTNETIRELASAGARNPRTLLLVETLYCFAEVTGQQPAKFVQEMMGLSPATAGRWIRASREKLNWGK